MSNIVFRPVSEPQSAFLKSDADLTLYGGAAFSGKSMCLLGSFLPLIQHSGTRGLIIRKTMGQLTGAGSLFDTAINLYTKIDPKVKVKLQPPSFKFSSGAELQFTYLDKPIDRQNLQGKEFSFIGLDELQQLDFDNVMYALSRLRSTRVNYQLQARATCNPDADSWLIDFVRYCLDERGIPIRTKDFKKRYFVRNASGIQWFDTIEKAQEIYGKGAESGIKSFKFIAGNIYDNPLGLELNKDYVNTLKALPRVEMERLLLGSWYARESSSGYFKREYVELEDTYNIRANKRVRAWDLAFSKPSEVRPDVDATAGVLMSKDPTSIYTIENIEVCRERVHEVEQLIFNTAKIDGKDVIISLPLDPGATAGAYCKDLARRLSERGYTVKLTKPEKGKLQRFLPFASVAEAGFVKVVRAEWNKDFFNELEQMDFTNKTHDDMADSCSDAFYWLNKHVELPSFEIPDLTSSGGNPLGFLSKPTLADSYATF